MRTIKIACGLAIGLILSGCDSRMDAALKQWQIFVAKSLYRLNQHQFLNRLQVLTIVSRTIAQSGFTKFTCQ